MPSIRRIILACVALCFSVGAGSADEFTAAQRAEIVKIMRDALKQDPSILRDAVVALQADEVRQAAGDAGHGEKFADRSG